MKECGWQEAVKQIYPFEINRFEIVDGDLTHLDNSPMKQIHLRRIHFVAKNILNVESAAHVYPSDVHLDGTIFDTGEIRFDGKADFLAVPHMGIKTGLNFERVALRDLDPLIRHLRIVANQGTLSGMGEIEYAPQTKVIHIEKLTIDQAHADYIYQPATAPSAAGEKTKEAAKESAETESAPSVLFTLDLLEIRRSDIGFVNKGANPNYRVFVDDAEFTLTHFSNHLTEGKSEAKLKGKFMGSGSLAGIRKQGRAISPSLSLLRNRRYVKISPWLPLSTAASASSKTCATIFSPVSGPRCSAARCLGRAPWRVVLRKS